MPATDTVTVYRGEDAVLEFTMDPAADITGWTLLFTARQAGDSFTKTPSITDDNNGVMEVALSRDDTVDMKPGNYHYDLWRIDDGNQYPLASGALTIQRTARD